MLFRNVKNVSGNYQIWGTDVHPEESSKVVPRTLFMEVLGEFKFIVCAHSLVYLEEIRVDLSNYPD